MEFIYKYKKYILLVIILVILSIFSYCYYVSNSAEDILTYESFEDSTTERTKKVNTSFFVDVKGAVKKPGVYEFLEGDKVIDAINMAGGLTSKASTSNVNLSKKLTSEMVVYIFTKSELTTTKTTMPITSAVIAPEKCECEVIEVNNCIDNNDENILGEDKNTKININTASKDELMTLNSIGEAKAESIISYREKTPFNKIEDIMNVSGLGESIFNKIKDYITV